MNVLIFDQYLNYLKLFLQAWGWPIVFTFLALYLVSPYYFKFLEEHKRKAANDPTRVKILSAAMRRSRAKQQLEALRLKANLKSSLEPDAPSE